MRMKVNKERERMRLQVKKKQERERGMVSLYEHVPERKRERQCDERELKNIKNS